MSKNQRPPRATAGQHSRNQDERAVSAKPVAPPNHGSANKQDKVFSNPSPLVSSAAKINPKASGSSGRKSAVFGASGAAALSGKAPTSQSLKNASSVAASGDKGLDAIRQEEDDKWYQQTEFDRHRHDMVLKRAAAKTPQRLQAAANKVIKTMYASFFPYK